MFAWNRCDRKYGPLITQRAAGSLPERETRALERHLEHCPRCKAWERDLRSLVTGLREEARVDVGDHPSPEGLAALAAGGLGGAERSRIERHLDSCDDCRAEWNVATRWRSPPVSVTAESSDRTRRPWFWFGAGSLVTAAAAVILVLLMPPAASVLAPRGPIVRPAGRPVQLRGAHHRAPAARTALRVPPAGDLLLSLTVEAAPGSDLSIELLDEEGATLARAPMTLKDPVGMLFLSVPVEVLPAEGGTFRVTVDATGDVFLYPFRVEDGGP